MSTSILSRFDDAIKRQYDFIPYANWGNSEKGDRPAPYADGQTYPSIHPYWLQSHDDRLAIRLNNLVLVDYDGNKPEALGEIPSLDELATALGYASQQELLDKSLIQWNDELTSMHFLFTAPPEFSGKQSNSGTTEFFWKHIDIKTGNQLVYLKSAKHQRLFDTSLYEPCPGIVLDQLKPTSTFVQHESFDNTIRCTEHQLENAREWLSEARDEVLHAEAGNRNANLNSIACTASGLVYGGALDNQSTYDLLFHAAIESGLDRSEVIATLNSGWGEGAKTPRRDAPYRKPSIAPGEVFAHNPINDTNIDVSNDHAITESIQQMNLDPNDPNIGVLHTHYVHFAEHWVMDREGRYIDMRSMGDFSKTAFNALYHSDMPAIPGSKSMKKFVASDVFNNSPARIVYDTMYRPGSERIFTHDGKIYANSYVAYAPERPSDADITRVGNIVNAHLNWLFNDKQHRDILLDWLAWQVQETGRLVGWLPLILGCRGDGKSVLFELITGAVGSRNTKTMTNNSMTSGFQNWATGSAVTAFEELKAEAKDSRKVANDLKPFITESRITINFKGKPEVPVINTCNYIAFSNEPDPISIPLGDRRWFVLETNHFGMNSVTNRTQTDMKQHFDAIKDLVNREENHPALHWFLRDHKISDEFVNSRFRAPQTQFSTCLAEQTSTEREIRLQEFLDNAYFKDGRPGRLIDCETGFQIQDFRDMMPENWFQNMDKKPSRIVLGKWLRNLGYEYAFRPLPDGTQVKSFKRM